MSTYDTQNINLDLYSNSDNLFQYQPEDWILTEDSTSYPITPIRKPHRKYGIPKEPSNNQINTEFVSPSYEIKSKKSKNKITNEYSNVPISYIEDPSFENKPSYNSFLPAPSISQKPQNEAGHFAEPPPNVVTSKYENNYNSYKPSDEHFPPPQELPLNPNHKQPPYDFPKSSYEVPIYDPVPFDASYNEHREYYPPHFENPSANSNSNQQTQIQYKNNQNNDNSLISSELNIPATDASKHILDVPELKNAFESGQKYHIYANDDATVDESNNVEKSTSFENLPKLTWNPMRLNTRTNQKKKQVSFLRNTSNRFRHKHQTNPTIPPTTTSTSSNHLEIVSIQKSQSHSYYDGTVSPPINTIYFSSNVGNKNKNFEISTTPLTKSNVYQTNLFFSPQKSKTDNFSKKYLQVELPKNHKLF